MLGSLETNFSEILIEIHPFYSRKCISKCRLENDGHLLSASMCYGMIAAVMESTRWAIVSCAKLPPDRSLSIGLRPKLDSFLDWDPGRMLSAYKQQPYFQWLSITPDFMYLIIFALKAGTTIFSFTWQRIYFRRLWLYNILVYCGAYDSCNI